MDTLYIGRRYYVPGWERNNVLDKDLKTFPAGTVITLRAYVPRWERNNDLEPLELLRSQLGT